MIEVTPRPLKDLLEAASAELAANMALLAGSGAPPPEAFDVVGDASVVISSLAPAAEAVPGALCFAVRDDFLAQAVGLGAAAVIVRPGMAGRPLPEGRPGPAQPGPVQPGPVLVACREPRLLFAVILGLAASRRAPSFGEGEPYFKDRASCSIGRGVSFGPFSYVGAGVSLGDGVAVGPRVVIEDGAVVGGGTILHPGAIVRWGVKIGRRCQIHAGAVIGDDGFGYTQVPVPAAGRLIHYKNPHLGAVAIGDDVEIGALTAVDRGLASDTVVGRGTKIDNLVQIGHNCRIGQDCVIVSQVGMAGHAAVGDRAFVLGQAGLSHGAEIGHDAVVAGQAGVLGKIPPGRQAWTGTPAQPQAEAYRSVSMVRRDLPRWRSFWRLLKKGLALEAIRSALLAEERAESQSGPAPGPSPGPAPGGD
jgi:UDP-3-O-[3-hydroxymyristoyl] glucosamine N-acyltransferase